MDMQAGRSLTTGQSFGSFQDSISQRPQQTVSVERALVRRRRSA